MEYDAYVRTASTTSTASALAACKPTAANAAAAVAEYKHQPVYYPSVRERQRSVARSRGRDGHGPSPSASGFTRNSAAATTTATTTAALARVCAAFSYLRLVFRACCRGPRSVRLSAARDDQWRHRLGTRAPVGPPKQ